MISQLNQSLKKENIMRLQSEQTLSINEGELSNL